MTAKASSESPLQAAPLVVGELRVVVATRKLSCAWVRQLQRAMTQSVSLALNLRETSSQSSLFREQLLGVGE
jgi:hypothetical protein